MGMSGFRVVIGSVKPRKKAAVARKKLETAAADTNTMLNEFQAQIMPPLTKVSEIRQRETTGSKIKAAHKFVQNIKSSC
jgi:hypothetical protein